MKFNKRTFSIVSSALIALTSYTPSQAMNIATTKNSQQVNSSEPYQNFQLQDVHFTNFKRSRPANEMFPFSYKPNIPKIFLNSLLWVSESISATSSRTGQCEEEIGYVNFSYYNKPEKVAFIKMTDHSMQKNDTYDGYIYELFVKPPYRKLGLGTLLFDKAITVMRALECQKIMWRAHSFEEPGSTIAQMPQTKLNSFYIKRGGQLLSISENDRQHKNTFIYMPEKQ